MRASSCVRLSAADVAVGASLGAERLANIFPLLRENGDLEAVEDASVNEKELVARARGGGAATAGTPLSSAPSSVASIVSTWRCSESLDGAMATARGVCEMTRGRVSELNCMLVTVCVPLPRVSTRHTLAPIILSALPPPTLADTGRPAK